MLKPSKKHVSTAFMFSCTSLWKLFLGIENGKGL